MLATQGTVEYSDYNSKVVKELSNTVNSPKTLFILLQMEFVILSIRSLQTFIGLFAY